jgi:hypothetical protein
MEEGSADVEQCLLDYSREPTRLFMESVDAWEEADQTLP